MITRDSKGLQGATRCDCGLQRITGVYRELKGLTRGYKCVTRGYSALQGVTRAYRGLKGF